ncbi:MAG: hypothetical protein BJ554DRAFT_4292, partial [Olpidium bornovanus]
EADQDPGAGGERNVGVTLAAHRRGQEETTPRPAGDSDVVGVEARKEHTGGGAAALAFDLAANFSGPGVWRLGTVDTKVQPDHGQIAPTHALAQWRGRQRERERDQDGCEPLGRRQQRRRRRQPVGPAEALAPRWKTALRRFAQSAASSASATLSKGASDCAPPPAAGASAVPESQRRATKFREFAKLGLTDPSRRKYSASTLKALFKKCLEARTEKERFELFGEVLQVYVGLFGDVATPKIISESMDDLRGMTKVLSKYFIYHTNRAVETMTKAEAGAELLRILRSTERLYNALKTIELLTAGPVMLITFFGASDSVAVRLKLTPAGHRCLYSVGLRFRSH